MVKTSAANCSSEYTEALDCMTKNVNAVENDGNGLCSGSLA